MKTRQDSLLPPSIGERLAETNGRPSGFDYLRISLALGVVAIHTTIITGGPTDDISVLMTPLRPIVRAILPMFFALSGFLVAGSLERCRTMVSFLGLRIIRIYPALMVEVFLSAFIIGLSVSTFPVRIYLTSSEFYRYLLNIIGDIHYLLPGVFINNPYPRTVNAQLWTVPYELGCYLTLALLALIGLVRKPYIAPIGALVICILHLGYRIVKHHGHSLYIPGGVPGTLLIVSFLIGLSIYLYRDRIFWDLRVFSFCAFASLLFLWVIPFGEYPAVVLLAYVTVWLGLTDFRRLAIIRGADLSYGVYLYGFVIQQLIEFMFPQCGTWYWNMFLSIPCALIFAFCSWNLIEKPALKLRKPLMNLETLIFSKLQ